MQPRKTITPEELARWVPTLIAANNLRAFYNCRPWRHLSAAVLQECHHECEQHKAQGKYRRATAVHHKKEVRYFPWLALTRGNLAALCDECHYKIHHKHMERARLNVERW